MREFSLHSYTMPASRVAGQLSLHMELVTRDYQNPRPVTRAIQVRAGEVSCWLYWA